MPRVDAATCPATHAVQLDEPAEPATVPAWHSKHSACPVVLACVPFAQSAHALATAEPTRLLLPAPHFVHVLAAVSLVY